MTPDNSYQSLQDLHKVCLSQHIPFASYRLPQQSKISTLVQYQALPQKIDTLQNLEGKKGFVIAPFIENEKNATYLLSPDFIFESNNIDANSIQTLANTSLFLSAENDVRDQLIDTKKEDFIQQVENAKKTILTGSLHKVVLSKVRLERLKDDFDATNFFHELCNLYPHAMVYFIQLPHVGCWIGATPEPLMVIRDGKVQTVSLAGTQAATQENRTDTRWSNKEIDEQGIVTSYIERTLQALHIENYSLKGPTNYQAANLIHLKTSFEFSKTDLDNRLGEFINAMHPTPSVGGLPKDAALNFILTNEQHNRSYYSGILGPINIANETHLFVNLRCMQLFKKHLVIYSGAGITAASDAEKEWEETNHKMMTLLSVINKIR